MLYLQMGTPVACFNVDSCAADLCRGKQARRNSNYFRFSRSVFIYFSQVLLVENAAKKHATKEN
mgnify:FL=1